MGVCWSFLLFVVRLGSAFVDALGLGVFGT
jgi:hypothetical protein